MYNKTKIDSTKFIKDGNIIVCIMECYNRFFGTFVVRGVARCSEDDVYDEKIGCRIAKNKAKLKMYKKTSRFLTNVMKGLIEGAEEYEKINSIYRKHLLNEAKNMRQNLNLVQSK